MRILGHTLHIFNNVIVVLDSAIAIVRPCPLCHSKLRYLNILCAMWVHPMRRLAVHVHIEEQCATYIIFDSFIYSTYTTTPFICYKSNNKSMATLIISQFITIHHRILSVFTKRTVWLMVLPVLTTPMIDKVVFVVFVRMKHEVLCHPTSAAMVVVFEYKVECDMNRIGWWLIVNPCQHSLKSGWVLALAAKAHLDAKI